MTEEQRDLAKSAGATKGSPRCLSVVVGLQVAECVSVTAPQNSENGLLPSTFERTRTCGDASPFFFAPIWRSGPHSGPHAIRRGKADSPGAQLSGERERVQCSRRSSKGFSVGCVLARSWRDSGETLPEQQILAAGHRSRPKVSGLGRETSSRVNDRFVSVSGENREHEHPCMATQRPSPINGRIHRQSAPNLTASVRDMPLRIAESLR